MNNILTVKDEFKDKKINVKTALNSKITICEGMSQKHMNLLYDQGLTKYFDVVQSVSLIDDTIEVTLMDEIPQQKGLIDLTVTPTPKLKKKLVAAKLNN